MGPHDALTNNHERPPILEIGLICVVAFVLRVAFIETQSLWTDEAYSVWFSEQSWRVLWTEVPEYETHPVLYYSLLKLWREFAGSDLFALRFLSTLLNMAALAFAAAATWLAAPTQARRLATILTVALLCLSDTQLAFSHDARPYAMMSLAMAGTLFCLFYMVKHVSRASQPFSQMIKADRAMAAAVFGLAFFVALLMWSHNVGLFFGFLLGLCVLGWCLATRQSVHLFSNFLIVAAIALLLYLPNAIAVFRQVFSMGESGYWLALPDMERIIKDVVVLTVGTGPLALVGVWFLVRAARRSGGTDPSMVVPIVLVAMAVGPMLLTLILSHLWQPIYLRRTFAVSQVPLFVCLSLAPAGARALIGSRARVATGGLIVLLSMASAGVYLYRLVTPGVGRDEDFRGIVTQMIETSGPRADTIVMAYPTAVGLPLQYYKRQMQGDFEIVAIPGPFPVRDPSLTYPAGGGAVPAITHDMAAALEPDLENLEEVWVVHRAPYFFDPEGHVVKMLDTHLPCVVLDMPPLAQKRAVTKPDGTC